MSSFAQYYIRFLYEFAPYEWEKRQEYLAAFFEAEGWMDVSGQLRRLNKNMYIVHAEGRSMEPKIHDGDLCVFEKTADSRQR